MKSYVTLETNQCSICGNIFDTGNLLLDRRLRESFEHKTLTDHSLCPDCNKLYLDGYIALIGCDESKSDKLPNGTIKFESAYRTGNILHVKKDAWVKIFNIAIPESKFVFTTDEVIQQLNRHYLCF